MSLKPLVSEMLANRVEAIKMHFDYYYFCLMLMHI